MKLILYNFFAKIEYHIYSFVAPRKARNIALCAAMENAKEMNGGADRIIESFDRLEKLIREAPKNRDID